MSRSNYTHIASSSFPDIFHLISDANPSLSVFEKAWAAYYAYMQNDIIATGLMAFLLHECVYFGRCIPWIIIDMIPYFNKWKLQDEKQPSAKDQWQCTRYVLLTHFTVEIAQIW